MSGRGDFRFTSSIAYQTLTAKFITRAKKFPKIRMVDERNSAGSHIVYCIRNVKRKQTLQMNATREKNNNFRIPQLGVKLHYFAHY